MLIFDFHSIGNKLLAYRKRAGLTQAEVAEAAGLSDRTYADIERGSVNMRIETILKICQALHITPDDILTEENNETDVLELEIVQLLGKCSPQHRKTALDLLYVYLKSIQQL